MSEELIKGKLIYKKQINDKSHYEEKYYNGLK
jgi:hypothetical protein